MKTRSAQFFKYNYVMYFLRLKVNFCGMTFSESLRVVQIYSLSLHFKELSFYRTFIITAEDGEQHFAPPLFAETTQTLVKNLTSN